MTNVRKKKAALYARVSTPHQVDKDSLPIQKEDLINFSKYALGIDDYEIFEDAGYSAKNTSRPDYQRMMARIRQGEFSHMVVWKIDRISRNLLDFAEMYAELKRIGVTFVSRNEQFDTSSAIGEAMLKIILVFAELERGMTSERVTAVMLSRATEGKWNGGRCPYGYDYDKETGIFSINEEEAKIIRDIFDRYEMVKSTLDVAKSLNAKGKRTRIGAEWSTVGVWTILKNPFYYGALRYNYRNETKGKNEWTFRSDEDLIIIPGHHQPIVTKKQFDICNRILTKRGKNIHDLPRKSRIRKNCNVFAGLITCGCCGANYNASVTNKRANGESESMYLCSRRVKNSGDCTNKYVTESTVGNFVMNYISNMLRAKESFGRSTTIDVLERKLLRGNNMEIVDHIERKGLEDFYTFLKEQKFGVGYYDAQVEVDSPSPEEAERMLLEKEKRKVERAIGRLEALFLYDENEMNSVEFIMERKKLSDQLDQIDTRLQELVDNAVRAEELSEEEFINKASMFALTKELLSKREIDYAKFIKSTDPQITKNLVNTIIENFCILDGRVMSIRFKNGIEHRFIYKNMQA